MQKIIKTINKIEKKWYEKAPMDKKLSEEINDWLTKHEEGNNQLNFYIETHHKIVYILWRVEPYERVILAIVLKSAENFYSAYPHFYFFPSSIDFDFAAIDRK